MWDSNGKAIGLPLRGHQGAVNSVTFSPSGLKIVSGSDDRTVRLWDTKGNAIGSPLQGHQRRVRSVAFSPDGQRIVSGSDDRTVRLWEGGNWETWLQVACDRLRDHPVLVKPNTREARDAKKNCQK